MKWGKDRSDKEMLQVRQEPTGAPENSGAHAGSEWRREWEPVRSGWAQPLSLGGRQAVGKISTSAMKGRAAGGRFPHPP